MAEFTLSTSQDGLKDSHGALSFPGYLSEHEGVYYT